jgi:hypothetical protein
VSAVDPRLCYSGDAVANFTFHLMTIVESPFRLLSSHDDDDGAIILYSFIINCLTCGGSRHSVLPKLHLESDLDLIELNILFIFVHFSPLLRKL